MIHDCHKEEIISSIEKAINGNGQPGLREIVAKLSISVEGLSQRLDRENKRNQFSITTIISIGALIVAIIAIIYKL